MRRVGGGRLRGSSDSGPWPEASAAWGIPTSGLSLKPLVSSTENSAVAIEAATCWTVFISVEPRARLWSVSVCGAAVIIGIIVASMPRPMTNGAPSRNV